MQPNVQCCHVVSLLAGLLTNSHGFADCWEQGKLVVKFCGYLSNKHKRETNASGGAMLGAELVA